VTIEARIAAFFRLDEEGWTRHANPWSGWTRFATLPLFALAAWSRIWIGGWWLLPAALLLGFIWINPRLFPPPASMDAWISRGVLGERFWVARDRVPIPPHHRRLPHLLSCAALVGLALLAYGIVALDAGMTLAGLILAVGGKLWFVDRMTWLHADMKDTAA